MSILRAILPWLFSYTVEQHGKLKRNKVDFSERFKQGAVINGVINAEALNSGISRYRTEIKSLKNESELNKQDFSLYRQYLNKAVDLLSNISPFYQKADASIKRRILGSIFPENLFFSKEKSRTARINEAVRLILNTSKGFREQETGQIFKNLELSGEVEITGVEPVTFCMPC